jgi:GDPmannose 4,6-dehydratase
VTQTSGRRALVTGVGGQDGGYLAEQLLAEGYQVFGLVRGGASRAGLEHVPWLRGVHLIDGDLRDRLSLVRALDTAAPDEVYNLASYSQPGRAWSEPEASADVNALGPLRLLSAIADLGGRQVRFCQASTSEIFAPDTPNPQDETTPLRPLSPYGAAKAYAHQITMQYRHHRGFFACGAILYNHESPRRPEQFVTRKVTRAAARIKLGRQSTVVLGNLTSARDWGYAPDYVRAMRLMLWAEQPDDYVIGTGRTHTIGELVEIAFARVGLRWQDHVEIDAELARLGSSVGLAANSARARERLGWEPSVDFGTMIEEMVDADLALESVLPA